MDESEHKSITHSFQGDCTLTDSTGKLSCAVETWIKLDGESLALNLPGAGAQHFALRDIRQITEDDYKLKVDLLSGDSLLFKYLGRDYDEFVRLLWKLRSEVIIKDLLMREPILMQDINAEM